MSHLASHLIDGSWVDTGARREVLSPVDGSVIGHLAYDGPELATEAADAAASAFPAWSGLTARQRATVLHAAADLIDSRGSTIALLLARESGKLLSDATAEVRLSADYFRWFAEEIRRPHGSLYPQENPQVRHLSLHSPAGVVLSLTPWNFPCSIQARKLAPALAAGCTVVARVSEKCPLAVTEMIACLHDAGVPHGVINLVHGPAGATTSTLLEHPAVRVVTFTGSTPVGRSIMAQAAARVVRPLLELGGDAPFIVMPDADLDAAVSGAMLAKFRNNGQSCIAANRFFVHDDVFDEFVGRMAKQVDAMTLGDPAGDPAPDLGPLIDEARGAEVSAIVQDALDQGGRLATQDRETPGGSFCAPGLVVDAPDTCRLAREEVFGPAAGVFRFTDTADVVRRANDTEMGLAAYLYTRDVSRAATLTAQLQAGIIGLNHALPTATFAPMGGVKQSGLGREGGAFGLAEFQEVTYVAMGVGAP
ncbi:NAD-dependent succinate-semialdehyde dehydrogenase [Monashia sp. NPDC004114]